MSRPFYYTIAAATALLGQERPRTKGQVIIREYTGGRWVEVRIGLRSTHGYTYHRITRAGVKFPDFGLWNDALKAAIERAQKLVQDVPANPHSVTLAGRQFDVWYRLNEFCNRQNVSLAELPDFLGRLNFQIQILQQEINEHE